ncbi:MAG: glycosyltransferase family 4 protein [Planctomycetota bacterium]
MRLALIISTLKAGGAERVMATLANAWVKRGDCVTLITLGSVDDDFYPLDSRVHRIGLNLVKNTYGVFDRFHTFCRRASALRHSVGATDPSVVISFVNRTNLLTQVATWGLPLPVIVSERNDPREESSPLSMRLLRRVLYPQADAVVVQTNSVLAWAKKVAPKGRSVVIPNPVGHPKKIWAPTGQQKIVAIGRLNRQKGFDVLIEAFAKIAPLHPHWTLDIYGEGPERLSLELMIQNLRLTDRVMLRGIISDISSPLVEAGLFVMPSRYEGFPNALLEAMACGCPVISTDCPSGPAEIIRMNYDGWLVPPDDVNALANSMSFLVNSAADRQRLGANASTVLDRFGIDRILELWDGLFHQLSGSGHPAMTVSDVKTKPTTSTRAA